MKINKIRKLKSFINMCGIEAQKNIGSSDFDIWEERRKKAEKEIRQILLKEKQKFNIAMEEMECWKCETHLKECKKCRQNLLSQERDKAEREKRAEIREMIEKEKNNHKSNNLYIQQLIDAFNQALDLIQEKSKHLK